MDIIRAKERVADIMDITMAVAAVADNKLAAARITRNPIIPQLAAASVPTKNTMHTADTISVARTRLDR